MSPVAAMSAGRVADVVVAAEWDRVPREVRERTGLLVADTVGGAVAGAPTRAARTVAATLAVPRGAAAGTAPAGPPPVLWRAGWAMHAATAASALDFDDGHVAGGGIHPSAPVLAALLAAARGRDVPGTRLLAAQLVSYEVTVRAGRLLYPRPDNLRYHCAGTAGCIGAAPGVALLAGGDREAVRRALEIATGYAPMANFALPMLKESIGWGALSAVAAGELAVAGFHGHPEGVTPVPGPSSFGLPTPFDEAIAQDDPFVGSLGETYEILAGYLKPYASCRFTHAPADGLLAILGTGELTGADVERVVVRTHRAALALDDPRPPTLEHAQYSIPFVLGAILAHGDAGAAEIAEGRIGDAATLAAAARVRVEHAPELDALYPDHYPAEVVATARDGRELRERRVDVRGEPALPLTPAAVQEKFRRNTEPLIGAGAAAHLWELCTGLERHAADELLDALDQAFAAAAP